MADIARKLAIFSALKYNPMDHSVKVAGTEGKVTAFGGCRL